MNQAHYFMMPRYSWHLLSMISNDIWWGHNGLPKRVARLCHIQTLRLSLLWAACCICIWTGAGLQSIWTIQFNKWFKDLMIAFWTLVSDLHKLYIPDELAWIWCVIESKARNIDYPRVEILEVLAHRKNQVSVQAMFHQVWRFWKWQKLQKLRVSAIIDIKQTQVLKNRRSKEKDVKPCLSLVLPRCSEAIGPAASMCWRNWSDMAAPMPGPMGRGLAKIAGLESFPFAFVKPKSHSSIHQPCQCKPLHGPSPSISPSRLHILRIREKTEKGWKKVFLRSTSAQFAEIANTKSLSAALMGSSIWPPNGPILRNAPVDFALAMSSPVQPPTKIPRFPRGPHSSKVAIAQLLCMMLVLCCRTILTKADKNVAIPQAQGPIRYL